MKMRRLLFSAASMLAGLFPSSALAAPPSFDCAKARQAAEFTICASPQLSELDNVVAHGYAYLKAARGRQLADGIAGPYLLGRYKCGYDETCLASLYLREIEAFAS